jgi:hypothetical protein
MLVNLFSSPLFLSLSLAVGIFYNLFERIRVETYPIGFVKFTLELDPMKTKSMEKAFQHIHHQQHTSGNTGKDCKPEVAIYE